MNDEIYSASKYCHLTVWQQFCHSDLLSKVPQHNKSTTAGYESPMASGSFEIWIVCELYHRILWQTLSIHRE